MNYDNPYSDLKVFHHTDELGAFLNNKRFSPIYIRLKPTNVCNQRCFYCCYADDQAVAERKVSKADCIPQDKMREILSDIAEMGVKAVTLSGGGEPLCYPYIEEVLEKIAADAIDLSMISNGQLLKGTKAQLLKNAKWVRISLDSANQETYRSIRGVETFDDVIKNIEDFAAIKSKTCELGINYVINKMNYNQVYDICNIASKIGVNNIKFSGLMIQNGTHDYHKEIKEEVANGILSAQKEFGDKLKIINKYEENLVFERNYPKCHIMNFVTIIAADQHVYTCHQKAYTKSGDLGSVENCSFKELWYSKEVIQKMKNFSPLCECKAACVYDQRNILLSTLKNLDKNHINFI